MRAFKNFLLFILLPDRILHTQLRHNLAKKIPSYRIMSTFICTIDYISVMVFCIEV